MLNYYQLMNLKTDASPDDIRHAYRKLMRKYHPDLSNLPRDEATQKSAELNEAYRTLIDQKKRLEYDNLLKLRGERVISYSEKPIIADDPQSQASQPSMQQQPNNIRNDTNKRNNGPAPTAQQPRHNYSDENYLTLFADRQKYKAMIDQYYAVNNNRFKPDWSNVDMHKYLKNVAQGVKSKVGLETDILDLFDVDFDGSDWSNLVIEKFSFRNSSFCNVNFQGAFFFDCEFSACDFTGSNFTGAFFQNPDKIQKCKFTNCKFDQVTWRGQIKIIRQCDFKSASGKTMDFTDLTGKFKQDLKSQVKFFLTEPQFKNAGTAGIAADIEATKPPKKSFWLFGK